MSHGILRNPNINYAGFWVRFIASFIDSIILTIILIIPITIIGLMIGFSSASSDEPPILSVIFPIILYILLLAIGIGYFAWFHSSKYLATPGKMLMGIKVVGRNGERISFLRGVGRYFALFLSSILYIGYIMAAFHPQKCSLHDIIASTYVVNAASLMNHQEALERQKELEPQPSFISQNEN